MISQPGGQLSPSQSTSDNLTSSLTSQSNIFALIEGILKGTVLHICTSENKWNPKRTKGIMNKKDIYIRLGIKSSDPRMPQAPHRHHKPRTKIQSHEYLSIQQSVCLICISANVLELSFLIFGHNHGNKESTTQRSTN